MASESVSDSASTSQEGNPAVEQAEKQVLGDSNYQKVEVVHRFADAHPYVHPLLIGTAGLIIIGIIFLVIRHWRKGTGGASDH
jgi:hypothetical protein